ncbi:MAG TPA: hypothetical protein VMZ71_10805 [Gemmataceae bacterium]|nr:hypothetical protein [Gemmataceae bacterium]
MRCLLAVAVVVFASAGAPAADAPEDLAKKVALDMLKAIKAKNVDDAVKLTGTPYYFSMDGKDELIEKADVVKDKIKLALDKPIDEAKLPTDVLEVVPLEKAKEKFGGKNAERMAVIEKAMGKDGFVVVVGKDGKPAGGFLVAMKDGKAKIVGIPR